MLGAALRPRLRRRRGGGYRGRVFRAPLLSFSVCAALLGCAGPGPRVPPPQLPQDPAAPVREPGRPTMLQPFPPQTAQVGAAWIPWAKADFSPRTKQGGDPSARVADGDGWALRFGRYDDGLGSEFVFATTAHDDLRTGAELQTYAGYVDLTDRWELWRGPVFAWAGVGFGMGLIYFDWDRAYRSELTGFWQGEGILALQLGANASIEARVTGFWAAHPGRDAGTGVVTMLGGTLAF